MGSRWGTHVEAAGAVSVRPALRVIVHAANPTKRWERGSVTIGAQMFWVGPAGSDECEGDREMKVAHERQPNSAFRSRTTPTGQWSEPMTWESMNDSFKKLIAPPDANT